MRVINNKPLVDFSKRHPEASASLQAWRKIMEKSDFAHFSELKSAFNTTDKVGSYYVFDIGGNKYRLIVAIHFNRQMLFVRHVFTHQEYDKWNP